jgi:hypothetical protein
MQVSLQPTHSLANNKMNPKHSISNSAHYNQSLQYNIHDTNSQQFETVLNHRIIAVGYVKWEKIVSCFRWRIHQPIGKCIAAQFGSMNIVKYLADSFAITDKRNANNKRAILK